MSTRAALRRFYDAAVQLGLSIPIYGLFDLDPDGLAIYHTYKYGSKALAHNRLDLVVPEMQWIGPQGCHFLGLDDERNRQGLLRMSVRDRKKAIQMLQWDSIGPAHSRTWWHQELQTLLFMNMKFEIELLDWIPGNMITWLQGLLAADVDT